MSPINLMAPVNNLGYGIAGYNILRSLFMRGEIVCYFPIGDITIETEEAKKIIESCIKNSKFFGVDSPSVKIWHQNDMGLFPGRGPRVGFPIFELNKFSDVELHHLQSLDRVLVCSEWAKRVLEDNGIKAPIGVVPLGVDTRIFYREQKPRPYHLKDTTIFMNVGKWEVRKGHNELLEAFNKAFTPSDNVQLWMMNDNPFIGINNEAWKQKYLDSKLGDKVRIHPRRKTQAQMRELFNQVDCGVFPSHAEGWNLEILEMMACGANIIATNYSGHTEYLNESNAYLINPNGMESAKDGVWFHGQGEWCKYDIDSLVDAMRHIHKAKQDGLEQSPSCKETVEKFSWNHSAAKLMENING